MASIPAASVSDWHLRVECAVSLLLVILAILKFCVFCYEYSQKKNILKHWRLLMFFPFLVACGSLLGLVFSSVYGTHNTVITLNLALELIKEESHPGIYLGLLYCTSGFNGESEVSVVT
jgi:hypothetical protein